LYLRLMDYTIHPYEGIGAIRFGMTPEQVHEILGMPEDTLRAGKRCDLPADYYVKLGFFAYYKNPGVFEAVALGYGSSPIFHDVLLRGKSLKDIKDWMKSMGSEIQHFDMGFIAVKFGLVINCQEYSTNLDCECDSVIVCDQAYCDKFISLSTQFPREVVL
jgi:hypothetical protein